MATPEAIISAQQAFIAAIQAKVQATYNCADRIDKEYGIDNEMSMDLLARLLAFVKQSPFNFKPMSAESEDDGKSSDGASAVSDDDGKLEEEKSIPAARRNACGTGKKKRKTIPAVSL